jgi:hypothetical protein
VDSLALGERVAAGRVRVYPRELVLKMSKLQRDFDGTEGEIKPCEQFEKIIFYLSDLQFAAVR